MFVSAWEPYLCLPCFCVLVPLCVPYPVVEFFYVVLEIDNRITDPFYYSYTKFCSPFGKGVRCFIAWVSYMCFDPFEVDVMLVPSRLRASIHLSTISEFVVSLSRASRDAWLSECMVMTVSFMF